MSTNSFFNEQTEQSLVKTTIVSKYFDVWANVIISTQKSYPALSSGKIAYIDLFAGRGRYDDGTQSTPIKILKNAIKKPDIRDRLVTLLGAWTKSLFLNQEILNPSYKLVAPPLHEPPRDSTRTYRNTSWA